MIRCDTSIMSKIRSWGGKEIASQYVVVVIEIVI